MYGSGGHNFVNTMLKLADTHDQVRVVNDQIGAPTYTKDLAETVIGLFDAGLIPRRKQRSVQLV